MSLIERFKAWRKRRYWAARHMEFVHNMVLLDWRWLANIQVADLLTERYRLAMHSEWYTKVHEPIEEFRARLALAQQDQIEIAVQAEREACAQIVQAEFNRMKETEAAHYRLSPTPFRPSAFGFNPATVAQSRNLAELISARSHT